MSCNFGAIRCHCSNSIAEKANSVSAEHGLIPKDDAVAVGAWNVFSANDRAYTGQAASLAQVDMQNVRVRPGTAQDPAVQ